MKDYRIGPSKLSYDLGGCHRCFAESMNGEAWPDRPFPGIFSRLDRQQRDYFDGKPLSALLVKDNWGHYLMLDRELWSCLLAGLSLACLGEAIARRVTSDDGTFSV